MVDSVKRLTFVMIVLVATATFSSVAAAADIWIDRVEESGRLLVPLRGIFEAAGATVDWYGSMNGGTVMITGEGKVITMSVNSHQATINDAPVQLDVPPRLIGGRVHIPLRFAGEGLGRIVDYQGDRVVLKSTTAEDIVLLIKGEATSGVSIPYTPPPPPPPAVAGQLSITSPRPNDHVPPRAEVYGTAPGGSMLIINTEVRAQDDGGLLKSVPGIRHSVPADGNWHFSVSCPNLPPNIAEPLYYIIKAYYETPGYRSPEVSVKVFR